CIVPASSSFILSSAPSPSKETNILYMDEGSQASLSFGLCFFVSWILLSVRTEDNLDQNRLSEKELRSNHINCLILTTQVCQENILVLSS
ncbi:hypothetical protein QQP08_011914, partial [Theobroma cacao]